MLFIASAALMLLATSCKKEEGTTDKKAGLGLSPVIVNVEAAGGVVELAITGDEAWTVELTEWSTEEQDWCTANVTEGEGAYTLKLTVDPATSLTDQRSVIVEVSSATKTLQAKLTQATLTLGPGEVLITGLDGKARIWSAYNLAGEGVFDTDVEGTAVAFQFNRKKAWPFDPSKNNGVFNGGAPASEGMVPVEGFVEACKTYSEKHRTYNPDDPTAPVDDEDAWDDANDPCPEGWRVPTSWEIIQTLGFSDDHCVTKTNFNCIRVNAGERGFSKMGFIVGWGQNVPDRINKDNIVAEGGMFVPAAGWINSTGYTDRTWLVTCWGATSHNDALAGLYLTTYLDYCDHWGWGDGHKEFATVVRCIKK